MSLAPAPPSDITPRVRERVQFGRSVVGSNMLLVTVGRELDAGNALGLSRYVEPQLEVTSRLVVDLRALDSLAFKAFRSCPGSTTSCVPATT